MTIPVGKGFAYCLLSPAFTFSEPLGLREGLGHCGVWEELGLLLLFWAPEAMGFLST